VSRRVTICGFGLTDPCFLTSGSCYVGAGFKPARPQPSMDNSFFCRSHALARQMLGDRAMAPALNMLKSRVRDHSFFELFDCKSEKGNPVMTPRTTTTLSGERR